MVSQMIHIFLLPTDAAIRALLPDLSSTFQKVNAFFDYIGDYASFGVSYLGFTQETISLFLLIFTAIIAVPLTVSFIKIVLKWYRMLMP